MRGTEIVNQDRAIQALGIPCLSCHGGGRDHSAGAMPLSSDLVPIFLMAARSEAECGCRRGLSGAEPPKMLPFRTQTWRLNLACNPWCQAAGAFRGLSTCRSSQAARCSAVPPAMSHLFVFWRRPWTDYVPTSEVIDDARLDGFDVNGGRAALRGTTSLAIGCAGVLRGRRVAVTDSGSGGVCHRP
jgi:hypothetical protein